MYKVGDQVEIAMQFNTTTWKVAGKVIKKPLWLKPHEIALVTGNPDFPLSVVDARYVVGSEKTSTKFRSFKVKSKETTYSITLSNDNFSCNCMGFHWRHSCKHLDAVKKYLKKSA